MFSFGWSEIALTFIIVIIFIGPKEIPNLLKHIGTFTKAIKKISREFKSSLNEISKETELDNVKESFNDIKSIKNDLDPTNELKNEFNSIKKSKDIFEKEIQELNDLDKKK